MPCPAKPAPDFIPAESSTPDFIPAQPPATGGTVSAAPVEPWLTQLEHDMSEGGTRTLPGRILGRMQGRGEQGFSGFGEGPEGSESILASPEMGAIHTAQGITEIPDHPLSGLLHTAEGALQAAQLPTSFVAPEAAGTGTEIPTVLGIPNRGHAGRVLSDIGDAAKDVPVYPKNAQAAMGKFNAYIDRGGNGGIDNPVMRKLGNRIKRMPSQAPPPPAPPAPYIPRARWRPTGRLLGSGFDADVPLHNAPDVEAINSRPITLHQPDRPMLGGLPRPSEDVPMSFHSEEFPEQLPSATSSVRVFVKPTEAAGMGPGEYIGETPYERGGSGQTQGVWRPRKVFAEPNPTPAPSFLNRSISRQREPFKFSEARDFYTNVSDETKQPGFLRRAFEPTSAPRFRVNAGRVRSGLNADLTNAADTIGRGKDYTDAITEYRRGAQLNRAAKALGAAGLGYGISQTPFGKGEITKLFAAP